MEEQSLEVETQKFQRLEPGDERARLAALAIDRLRTKLLDLTNRNPLLTYRHSDRARAQVRVIDELPDVLYTRLSDSKSLAFRALEEPDEEPGDEESDEFHIALEAARLENPEYLDALKTLPDDDPNNPLFVRIERALRDRVRANLGLPIRPSRATVSIAGCARAQGLDPTYDLPRPGYAVEARHYDDDIQTLLFPDRMEAKLSALRDGARRALEETGINTLFAAYGFLEWYESQQSEKALYAPLLLQPLEMERVSQRGRWRYFVKGTGEETTINITLAERLKQDFALDLPTFGEDETPEGYFATVEQLIGHQALWRVRRFVTFGLFSFARLAMWHDLDPARWPTKAAPATNSVVATLLAGGGGEGLQAPEYEIDSPSMSARVPPLIRDADSSQLSAIIDAMEGKNLALKGPPGTGKSQTIANLIAAAISQGKRVLFIAEKMAALDVVKSRLDDAGLGHFVLELHSTKAKRKDVLNSLARRVEQQGRFIAPSNIAQERLELARLTRHLNDYVSLLNTPFGATGKTVQQILWAAQRATGDGLPDALDRLVLGGVSVLTLLDFDRAQAVLHQFDQVLDDVWTRWGNPTRHPWSWVARILSPFESEDLRVATREWRDRACELRSLAGDALALAPFPPFLTAESVEMFSAVLTSLPAAVPASVNRSLFARLHLPETRRAVAAFHRTITEREVILKRWTRVMLVDVSVSRHQELGALADLAAALHAGERPAGEADAILDDAARAREAWRAVERSAERFASLFVRPGANTRSDLALLLNAASLIQATPAPILARRRSGLASDNGRDRLETAVRRARELREVQQWLEARFDLRHAASAPDLRERARLLRETPFLRRFSTPYRAARGAWKALSRDRRTAARHAMAQDFERIAAHLEALRAFAQDPGLNILLGPHFDGICTDFEPLLLTAQFLLAAQALTSGDSDLQTHVREFLYEGKLLHLEQIAALAQSEHREILSHALVTLEDRRLDDVAAHARALDRDLDAARRLMVGVRDFGLAPHVPLRRIAELAHDMARLEQLDSLLRESTAVAVVVESADLDLTSAGPVLGESLAFAEALIGALDGRSNLLAAYLFHEDLDVRLALLQALRERLGPAVAGQAAARHAVLTLAGIAEHPLADAPLDELVCRLDEALAEPDALDEWNAFLKARADVGREGALGIVQGYGDQRPVRLADAYARIFWRSLARQAFDDHPDLRSLSGNNQALVRRRFREIDRRLLELNRQEIAFKLCQARAPFGNNRGPRSEWTEGTLILHQMQLQRPRIAIRDLIRRAGRAAQVFKPCWMMSPISVAQFLEPGTVEFDLVVIDEASQMRPEEAIGAAARGRQMVVVGDPMQLPPTTFFDRMDGFDDEDTEDMDEESILDMALGVFRPFRHLRWHYRSRHESLIRFSNKHFYEDKLIVFPSPTDQYGSLGVWYHQINGVYRGRGGNPDEVKAIAAAAVEAMHRYPKWSLGVVTVNRQQAELLRMEVDRLVLRDLEAQEYLATWEATLEPFFVKNLENVQGDERDIIMISTVYGPNEKGHVMQRFGPINQKTGHRRLNVLFTRAKYRIDLFSSLSTAQVREDPGVSWGVKTLRSYLEYAASGRLEGGAATTHEPDSDFEILVAEALKVKGYEVTSQVGVVGFYIDLAVKHPDYPHGYLAGIECDGATYHSAKNARDRDALRQEILESLGWRLHRVWSTDWFNNPRRELDKLMSFLEDLIRVERQR